MGSVSLLWTTSSFPVSPLQHTLPGAACLAGWPLLHPALSPPSQAASPGHPLPGILSLPDLCVTCAPFAFDVKFGPSTPLLPSVLGSGGSSQD